MLNRIFGRKPARTNLAAIERDDTITRGSAAWDSYFRDRTVWDRASVIEKVVTAYRNNPIARRLIEIQTHFAIGDGFKPTASAASAKTYLAEWWTHPLNDLDSQLPEWLNEATITGDLFLLCSVDRSRELFVRAVPSEAIKHIRTADNDYRQEVFYQTGTDEREGYTAYNRLNTYAPGETFMLHFPLNRLVGQCFGESDLVSVLYYITLYKQWLDDRARSNYFRMIFSYVVQKAFNSNAEKANFAAELNNKPPAPGSILVIDPEETWGTLSPNLGSFDSEIDGLAIKRMIATGAGIPMHYLAEPESSTRTTADAAGTPTFKRFKSRQTFLRNAVMTLAFVALKVRGLKTGGLEIQTPDVTERDNSQQATGVLRIVQSFSPLYNAGLVDATEFIRVVYRYLAEQPPEIPANPGPVQSSGGQKPPVEKPPEEAEPTDE